MIASGSSLRGLSLVTTTSSLTPPPCPISGRFARSLSPPAPEHHGQAPGFERTCGSQDVFERILRVGVVHDHREGLSLVDPPQTAPVPPRHGPDARRDASSRRQPAAIHTPDSAAARCTRSSARTASLDVDPCRPEGRARVLHLEPAPLTPASCRIRPNVTTRIPPCLRRARPRASAPFIVAVDHRVTWRRSPPLNNSCLAAKYSSIVAVEIQMVLRQVREDERSKRTR